MARNVKIGALRGKDGNGNGRTGEEEYRKEKGQSGEEAYDRATWTRISTPIKVVI